MTINKSEQVKESNYESMSMDIEFPRLKRVFYAIETTALRHTPMSRSSRRNQPNTAEMLLTNAVYASSHFPSHHVS